MDRPIELSWWRKKPWTQLGVVAIAVALGGLAVGLFSVTAERSVRIPITNVTVATVTRSAFHDFVPVHAKVEALNTIYLDAMEGGRVEHVLAYAGDFVQQGQSLVELSNTELELDVLEREARIVESITELQAYETQLEQNRVTNEKALAQIQYEVVRLRRSLARRTALAVKALEPAETRDLVEDELNYDLAILPVQEEGNAKQNALRVRQLPQIESQLVKLQQDLRITHGKLDNLTVRAPVSGRLTSMDLKVGENRGRGERLAEITPATGYKLSADVDEYYLARVHEGQVADVEVGDRTYQTKVTRAYPQVKGGTFTVDLSFQGSSPAGLLPGESVLGRLSLGADQMALMLPAGAFLERTGGGWAFVLDHDGRTARRRSIKLGRRNAGQAEVLGGLGAGEQVIISDYSGLEHLDRVDLLR